MLKTLFQQTTRFRGSLVLPIYRQWIKRKSNILDVGCGDGILSDYFCKHLDVRITGYDVINYISPQFNLPFIFSKSTPLTSIGKKFDVVMINDVLHHIEKEQQFKILKNCLNLAGEVVILEDLPYTPTLFFDIAINKIREPDMNLPLSFRPLVEWEDQFLSMNAVHEFKVVKSPWWYPFKHAAFRAEKAPHSLPLVSVVISTFNEEKNIARCLKSLSDQTYSNVEIIVVDSPKTTDNTAKIAKSAKAAVYVHGNERSSQRNFGVKKATGKYVVIIDADMQLKPNVIKACVFTAIANKGISGVIIPEISVGIGYWAKSKALEKNCYLGDDSIEAARFISRADFLAVNGYNPKMISGEDWDLNRKIAKRGSIGRINNVIYHHEGKLSFVNDLKKKYYYSQQSNAYLEQNVRSVSDIFKFVFRPAYFRNIHKLLADPIHLPGFIIMKTGELLVGGFGAIVFKKEFWRALASNRS